MQASKCVSRTPLYIVVVAGMLASCSTSQKQEPVYTSAALPKPQYQLGVVPAIYFHEPIESGEPFAHGEQVQWVKEPTIAKLQELYPDSMADDAQGLVNCELDDKGRASDCEIAVSQPDTEDFHELFLALAEEMMLSSQQLTDWEDNIESVSFAFGIKNSMGVRDALNPCVPFLCTIVPPPPPPPPPPPSEN